MGDKSPLSPTLESVRYPELVFGIAGPVGVDMNEITNSVANALKSVQYATHTIKLTNAMREFKVEVPLPDGSDFFSDINFKMDYANALCRQHGRPDTLARIAIDSIIKVREGLGTNQGGLPQKTAYVIRQLKRPDEVELLRRVYGRLFILISAYASVEERRRAISAKLRHGLIAPDEIEKKTSGVIERDANENEVHGQHLRDTFHLADVFVNGISRREMDSKLNRFVQAFFGRTDISPSKDEYGMYAAKSASLRSSDLSRQVGAAIFTLDGELITQGCNEVPKAFGGTYWDLEQPDNRDVILGYDPNDLLKKELLREMFERLQKNGLLSETANRIGTPANIVEHVTRKAKISDGPDARDGALVGASVMDLTEYGRVVHAEMCALCDAARLGRSVKGSVLYCTTFPCHNCTKHIIASGIRKVVYMEPYPKSKAKELHENEIEIERDEPDRVSFVPFIGISPYRYRDIFQKGKRKRGDGTARRWYDDKDEERPMVEVHSPTHPEAELAALAPLIGGLKNPSAPDAKTAIEPKAKRVTQR